MTGRLTSDAVLVAALRAKYDDFILLRRKTGSFISTSATGNLPVFPNLCLLYTYSFPFRISHLSFAIVLGLLRSNVRI
jgi:hypothetical protein